MPHIIVEWIVMKIFSGSSNKPLAERIAECLNLKLSPIEFHVFPDGERRIKLNEEVVDDDTIVVQSTATPVDQNYMELFFIIDALKRSGAKRVTVVIPYVGYQRQDHVFREGEAVSLRVMITILESLDVDRVVVLDLHSIKIPEFFKVPLIHLSALPLFAEVIEKLLGEGDGVLVSPDMGGLRRIQQMSEYLNGMPWVATVKDRNLETGEITINTIDTFESGLAKEDLRNRTAFIVDDMASSGKTLVDSAKLLGEHGVSNIFAFTTHPIFSADAPMILEASHIERVYVTDSVFIPEEKKFPKLNILSMAEIIANKL
jgi:ribose-phosphate pyrophosphokinase